MSAPHNFGPDCEECEGHCLRDRRMDCLPIPADRNQGWPGIYAVLYTDSINDEQTCRDDLWIGTTEAIKRAVDKAQTEAYAEGRKDEREQWEPVARKALAALETCDGGDSHNRGYLQWFHDEAVASAITAIKNELGEEP